MTDGDRMLELLRARRSEREFTEEPVPREQLERLLEAAISAPSATNRQPWRFAVVRAAALRRRIVEAVRERARAMTEVIRRSHHADEFTSYDDFFFEPLAGAQVIVVPQYRTHADLVQGLLASAGADPAGYDTPAQMQPELCATSAAVMALLVQAHAEGLGACWMAGPMVARREVEPLLGIAPPWRMLGAVALGHPARRSEPKGRRPLDRAVVWFDEEPGGGA